MAKVKHSDLFDKNIFEPTIQGGKELLDIVRELKGSFVDISKTSKKSLEKIEVGNSKQIQETEEAINKVNKSFDEFQKLEEQEVKLKKQLQAATDEEVKGKLRLQKVNREQKRQLEAQLILENKQVKTLAELRAQNKALRIERDRLDIEGQADQIAELNERINENNDIIKENVDALTKQKINIGNYKDSVTEALEETGAFSGIMGKLDEITGGLASRLVGVTGLMKKNEEATEDAGKAATTAGKRFGRLGKILKASVIGIVVTALASVGAALSSSRKAQREFEIATQQFFAAVKIIGSAIIDFVQGLIAQMGVGVDKIKRFALEIKESFEFGDAAKATRSEIAELNKSIEEGQKKAREEYAESSKAFSEFSEVLGRSNERIRDILESEDRLIDRTAILTSQINKLIAEEERLNEIAGDGTIAFSEQQKAIDQANGVLRERIALQKELAEEELRIATRRIQQELETQGIFGTSEEQIRTLKFLEDVSKADAVSLETLERLKTARGELAAITNEQLIAELQINRTAREIARDRFEQELDFAIDLFDAVKTRNERIIQSDQFAFEKRAELFEETQNLAEKSFNNQISLITNFVEESLALQENLTEEEKKQTLEQLNLRELIQIDDEEEVRRRLRLAKIDEITNTRILEFLRERRAVLQDLLDIERELEKEAEEAGNNLIVFRQEQAIRDQERLRALTTEGEITVENTKRIISSLEKQAELEEKLAIFQAELALQSAKTADERILIEEQLADKLLDIELEKNQKIAEANEKLNDKLAEEDEERVQKRADQAQEILAITENLLNNQLQRRQEALDEEIQDVKDRQDVLRELANQGSQDAVKSLAFEQKKQAELERERQRLLEKQKRAELGFAALKSYIANVSDPETQNPLQKTFRDLLALSAFVENLPTFWEGAEHVEKALGKPQMPGRDGYVVRVDGSERVVDGQTNKKLKGISNKELGNLALMYKNDSMPVTDFNYIANIEPKKDTTLVSGLKILRNEVRELPKRMPVNRVQYDEMTKMLVDIVKQDNKITRTHSKKGGIWGM